MQAVCGDRVVGGRSLSRAHKALLCELARFWLLFFPFFSVSLRVFPWVGCAGTHGGQTPRENWENRMPLAVGDHCLGVCCWVQQPYVSTWGNAPGGLWENMMS